MGRASDSADLGGPRPRAPPRLASGWARPGLGTGPLADGTARGGYEPRAAADDRAPRPGGRGLGAYVSPRRRAPRCQDRDALLGERAGDLRARQHAPAGALADARRPGGPERHDPVRADHGLSLRDDSGSLAGGWPADAGLRRMISILAFRQPRWGRSFSRRCPAASTS